MYSTRLSPTLQATVAAISDPRYSLYNNERATRSSGVSPNNMMLSLQHDTGRWCTEYTYSAEDGMWGVRCLHNFGKIGGVHAQNDGAAPAATVANGDSNIVAVSADAQSKTKPKRVDEEDAMEGGLKGRISAGAEFYLSRQEKSAGGTHPALIVLRSTHRQPYSDCRRAIHHASRRDTTVISTPRRCTINPS